MMAFWPLSTPPEPVEPTDEDASIYPREELNEGDRALHLDDGQVVEVVGDKLLTFRGRRQYYVQFPEGDVAVAREDRLLPLESQWSGGR